MVNQAYIDKRKYGEQWVYDLLDNFDTALIVHCDNVGSRQFMDIRSALRPNSVVLMGKNTLIKDHRQLLREKGNDGWMRLHELLVGNVGVIFTKDDVKDVKTKVSEFVVPAPAKVGSTATCDVTIPAGVTPLEPSQTGFPVVEHCDED